MNVTVDFRDVGIFVLFCLSAIMCVFLIVTIRSINKFVKKMDLFAEVNGPAIGNAITQLLELTRNVNALSRKLGYGIDSVGSVVGSLNSILVGTASVVGSGTSNVIDGIAMAGTLLKAVLSALFSRKKGSK